MFPVLLFRGSERMHMLIFIELEGSTKLEALGGKESGSVKNAYFKLTFL